MIYDHLHTQSRKKICGIMCSCLFEVAIRDSDTDGATSSPMTSLMFIS